jgi:hypothetical protein
MRLDLDFFLTEIKVDQSCAAWFATGKETRLSWGLAWDPG